MNFVLFIAVMSQIDRFMN